MKKMGWLFIGCLVLSLSISSCALFSKKDQTTDSTQVASEGDATAKEIWKIGVVGQEKKEAWTELFAQGVGDYQKSSGQEIEYAVPEKSGSGAQIKIIEQFIASGCDAICVSPSQVKNLDAALKKAQEKGIKVVVFQSEKLTAKDFNLEPFLHTQFGAFLMDNLANQADYTGDFVILSNKKASDNEVVWEQAAQGRFTEVYGEMNLVHSDKISGMDGAYKEAKKLINNNPDLKGFISTDSEITLGIAKAVKELKAENIKISGLASPKASKEYIEAGIIKNVAFWNPYDAGYSLVVLAHQLLKGQPIGDGTNLLSKSYENLSLDQENSQNVYGGGWFLVDISSIDVYNF